MSWHDTNATAAAACGIAPQGDCICGLFRHKLWANWRCPERGEMETQHRPPMTSLAFVAKALGYPQPRKRDEEA